MFVDGNVLPVCMTTNVDRTNNVVIAYVSVVSLLVPVRTTTNVDGARNAVIKNALVVRLLVPVHTTTNVTVASNAVIANASVNRLLVPARTTTNVTLERIVVREFVPHTVVGAVELLQALLSARLSSWPSSFPSYPAAAVLVVRTTAYTRYCGRHRPTATTNGLNPHDDDATSTCSSAVELHPAFSRWIQPASSNRLQPVSSSWLLPASSRFQSGSSASLKLSTTNKLICSSAWNKRKRRRCQQQ